MGILQESAGLTDRLTPPSGFIRAHLDVKAFFNLLSQPHRPQQSKTQHLSLDKVRGESFPSQFMKIATQIPRSWPKNG